MRWDQKNKLLFNRLPCFFFFKGSLFCLFLPSWGLDLSVEDGRWWHSYCDTTNQLWLTAKHAGEAATLLHLQLDGVKMLCSCQNSSCLDLMLCSSWRGSEGGRPRRSVYLQTAHRRLSKPHQALQTTHRLHTAGRGSAGTILKGFSPLLLLWNVTCKHVYLCKSIFNTLLPNRLENPNPTK